MGLTRVKFIIGIVIIAAVVAGTSYYFVINQQHVSGSGIIGTSTMKPASSPSTAKVSKSSVTSLKTLSSRSKQAGVVKVIGVTDLSTPKKLFSTIKYMRISLLINESPNKSMKVMISYDVSKGGTVNGQETYKVSIAISAKNTTQKAAVWVTKDFSTPLKLTLPNGKVLTGREAMVYGEMLLNQIGQYVLTKGEFGHLKVFIYMNGSMKTSMSGWMVKRVSKRLMSINGRSYEGYDIVLKNTNLSKSSAKEIDVGLAHISSNLWYFSYVKLNLGNGKSAVFKVEEIKLGTSK